MEAWPLWGLALARTAGVLALAPPLGWRHFPVTLRLAVAALVALPLSLTLSGPAGPPMAPPEYLAALIQEAATGLLMGLGLWLLIWGAFVAGHLQDLTAGFTSTEDEEGPLANLFHVTAILFFIQLNGPHWLLAWLRHSYLWAPPGRMPGLAGDTTPLYWAGMMLAHALQLAAPVLLAVLLAAVMLVSLQRVLPGLRSTEVLPAVRAGVTLVTVALLAPLLGALLLQQIAGVAGQMTAWLTAP